jgi:hypothetical protein
VRAREVRGANASANVSANASASASASAWCVSESALCAVKQQQQQQQHNNKNDNTKQKTYTGKEFHWKYVICYYTHCTATNQYRILVYVFFITLVGVRTCNSGRECNEFYNKNAVYVMSQLHLRRLSGWCLI